MVALSTGRYCGFISKMYPNGTSAVTVNQKSIGRRVPIQSSAWPAGVFNTTRVARLIERVNSTINGVIPKTDPSVGSMGKATPLPRPLTKTAKIKQAYHSRRLASRLAHRSHSPETFILSDVTLKSFKQNFPTRKLGDYHCPQLENCLSKSDLDAIFYHFGMCLPRRRNSGHSLSS